MRIRILTYLVAVTLPVSSASAQSQQTSEGARKFLSLVFNNGSTIVQDSSRNYEDYPASADWDGECKLIVTSQNGPVSLTTGFRPNWFSFDFSKVTGIQRAAEYRDRTIFKLLGYDDRITVYGENLSTRFEYAAQFLINACDPAANTGF